MSASTDFSPTVDRLRYENTLLRREVRYLRRRVLRLTCSRDYWKAESERWKWGALR